jgi:hypothetical protein
MSITLDQTSNITLTGTSPQNRPLNYTCKSDSGTLAMNGNTGTFSPSGAPAGPVSIKCSVADDKGQTSDAICTVTIVVPEKVIPHVQPLCSIDFAKDKQRPTRVDNEAKACLDEIALNLQRSSDAKLALVGNEDAKEKAEDDREQRSKKKVKAPSPAAVRAVNTKDYLVKEKGIDSTRIMVYTGTDDAKTVTTTLIPTGAVNPDVGDTVVDESAVKAVPRTPLKLKKKK